MSEDVLEQAADWFDRHDSLNDNEQQAFARWIAVPAHQKAFTRIAKAMGEPELAQALVNAATSNVSPIAQPIQEKKAYQKPSIVSEEKPKPRRMPWLASAASVAVVGGLMWMLLTTQLATYHLSPKKYPSAPELSQSGRFYAAVASRTSHVLQDGSVVYLNGDSQIEVNTTENERRVNLSQGQAYFAVAHEPERPFIVNVDNAKIQVVGTAFDVDKLGDQIIVSVYEGIVKVTADETKTLTKGQGAVISGGKWSQEFFVNSQLPSWRTGWLEVNGSSLTDVAQTLQRYTRKPIRLDAQGDYMISGRFNLDAPKQSLKLVASSVGLSVTETSDEFVLQAQKP